jgi:hypothetical protein
MPPSKEPHVLVQRIPGSAAEGLRVLALSSQIQTREPHHAGQIACHAIMSVSAIAVSAITASLRLSDGALAVFHGPRLIARYTAQGTPIATVPTRRSLTPCSPPSRRGLASAELGAHKERRPALTAPARGATRSFQNSSFN